MSLELWISPGKFLDTKFWQVGACFLLFDGCLTIFGGFAGATRPQYAPEPLDVGKILRADVGLPDGILYVVATSGPVDGGKSF